MDLQVQAFWCALVLTVQYLWNIHVNNNRQRRSKMLTFSLADVKSTFVTLILRSLRASRPASVHTALISAPLKSSLVIMNSSKSTSSARLIRLVCSLKMWRLVRTSGNGNSIFRSIRPGRMSAGSSDSILLVAMMTLTSPRVSKPSNWFKSSNMVR